MNHFTIDQRPGLSPEKSAEENWAKLAPAVGRPARFPPAKRHAAQPGRRHRRSWSSASTASISATPTTPPRLSMTGRPEHIPTRPGTDLRAKHQARPPDAPRIRGTRRSSASPSAPWSTAASSSCSPAGERLGLGRSRLEDRRRAQPSAAAGTVGVLDVRPRRRPLPPGSRHRGVSSAGAVLVRPDRYIAFRCARRGQRPHATTQRPVQVFDRTR